MVSFTERELEKVKSSLAPVNHHVASPSNRTSQQSVSPGNQPSNLLSSQRSLSPNKRRYVIASARANDPPRDDRPVDLNLQHIKQNLFNGQGISYCL